MKPRYDDGFAQMYVGDAIDVLSHLPEKSIHCCVTSPPYFGLRSYLAADHPDKAREGGTQNTPEQYIQWLVDVFRGVWRVLRDDGTCWIVIGDGYTGGCRGGDPGDSPHDKQRTNKGSLRGKWHIPPALKPKDLLMIPARVALALQADGWFLRSQIVWTKPNPMPESVTDRPTQATEMVYLLTKRPRYFYDADAVKERDSGKPSGNGFIRPHRLSYEERGQEEQWTPGAGRNLRNYWPISTRPFRGSHYAVFPPELPLRCIKAGTSEHGVCGECGAPWRRVIERTTEPANGHKGSYFDRGKTGGRDGGDRTQPGERFESRTIGFEPTCSCGGSEDLAPGDLEIIATPTGERIGDDPSLLTGRAGYNRPRGPKEGQRLITRYEQRRYALQLRESSHKATMSAEAGPAFAHYVRTDKSGARPLPPSLLEDWIARGWLVKVDPPNIEVPETTPATVLDPFSGSGTTGLVARKLGRRSVLIDLDDRNVKLLEERMGYQGVLL